MLKKIISISLSLILLLGNVSLTYGTHFCGGHAVINEVMLGHEHMDCGMGMMDMDHFNDDFNIAAPDCCTNQYISVETDQLFKQDVSIDLGQIFVLATLSKTLYLVPEPTQESSNTAFIESSPPLPHQRLHLLNETFLI